MKLAGLLVSFGVLTLAAAAQEAVFGRYDVRYKIEHNLERYPQKKAPDALKSVVRAVGEKRFDYLMAQLCLPAQVDARVLKIAERFTKGSLEDKKLVAFEELVQSTAEHYLKDPDLLRELRLFLAGAEWDEKDGQAVATHKGLPGRKLILHKLEGRWFLDNRQK